MSDTSPLPLYLTAPEAAEILRVKPDRVRRWIETGELVASDLGDRSRARYRISRADLLAFLERRAARSVRQPAPKRRRRRDADLIERY